MIIKSKKTTLHGQYNWREIEASVRDFYEQISLNSHVYNSIQGQPVGYVEGPPTLNNQPHVGHLRGRIMKDLWFRFNTLKKIKILFRGGWDTQGLPVELEAEKELGLHGNKWENLRAIGEERLVDSCKRLIQKYKTYWEEADKLLGLYMDQENAYMTYKDNYIEREWKYLQKAWEEGLLGEGYKVVPYCPSCQTALSHAELNLGGYEKLEDPSLYYKVRCDKDTYLIVWTTMPFTLITDQLIALKPEAEYALLKKGNETWIIAKERVEEVQREIGIKFDAVLKVAKGKDLEGIRYEHPFLDLIPGLKSISDQGKAHFVVAEDFVDTTTGSGIVHLSPANGEEDYDVAIRRKLPIFSPFDEQVRFTRDAGYFQGIFARDADEIVINILRERNLLVYSGKLVHDYPVCWRSGHRIVWLARKEYFYWIDKVKGMLIQAAEKVEYFFEAPRNRFLEFIKESPAWCISRERVWGTPLPVWVCSSCGEKNALFSRKEIVENAVELPDGASFELHRPWIDRIVIRCKKCGSKSYREPYVLDTWHNSGSAPYASMSDSEYSSLVPVPFLTEGIDQTRGWAYTLLVLNVLFSGKPVAPFKSFLFQGHVLDEKGRKMSKSLGNVVWAIDLMRENSVDLVRFYLLWKSSPEDSLTLDLNEMRSRPFQVLNTLYHLHYYFSLNSSLDNFDYQIHTVDWARSKGLLTIHDKWLLTKILDHEQKITKAYDEMRFNDACKEIEKMIIETLSQGYVRIVRPELWSEETEYLTRRLAMYSVLAYALMKTCTLLHPVSPFITEYLYQNLFAKNPWKETILLDSSLRSENYMFEEEEKLVDSVLEIEKACNSARNKCKLKRRWPIEAVYVLSEDESVNLKKVEYLINSLCNSKRLVQCNVKDFPSKIYLKPNLSKIGSLFKKAAKEVMKNAPVLEGDDAIEFQLGKKKVTVDYNNEKLDVPISCFDLVLEPEEGYEVAYNSGFYVAIKKQRNKELIAEGLIRDVARRIQALRKQKGLNPAEVVSLVKIAGLDEEDARVIKQMEGTILFLVRAKKIELQKEKDNSEWTKEELDGKDIYLQIKP